MAKLSLRHIYKVYPNGVKAVNDFNMEIADKEFIVFVGPSGCGKSTTLRMIAGLEEITAGEFYIGDELVNDMEPKDRDIAMVFQNYALYPHMTVYDNMAFGLKLRHIPNAEIHKRVLWAADALKITEYLSRKPKALSGGQRQRVALGRAILRNPKAFLLDEPLSNLDAKLRTEMRAQIAKLHQQLNTTFIYVTHDQVEAMTLGTRVVVMKLGYVQQIDTPQNLYDYPENKFVAGFIGTPQMNFFEGTLLRKGDTVEVKFDYCDSKISVPFNELLKVRPSYLNGKTHVWIGLRCEDISLDPEIVKNCANKVKIKVSHFEELGNETLVYGDLNMEGDGFQETSTRVIVKSYHGALHLKPGDIVDAALNMKKAHFFDKENELTILPRLPKENVFDCDIKDNSIVLFDEKIKLPPALKLNDEKNVELFVPVDGVDFNGDIKAKVVNIEDVNGSLLYYLQIKDRVFFVRTNKKLEIGEEVNLGIDFKRISIRKGDNELVKSLNERDVFVGNFSNYSNDKKAVNTLINYYKEQTKKKTDNYNRLMSEELGKNGYSDYLLKEYKKEYKEQLEANKAEFTYSVAINGLTKEGKENAKKILKEKNNEALIKYNEKVSSFKADSSKKDMNDEVATEIKNKYLELISKENALLNERIAHLEKCSKEYANTLMHNEIDIHKEYKTKLKEITDDFNAHDKASQMEMKSEVAKNINELKFNSKLFYLNIEGVYLMSTPEINKKIIQALRTGVFRTTYRYELSHYSYSIVASDGIEVEIADILDYGNEVFLKCKYYDSFIYVYTKEKYQIGQKINLIYNLDNIQIYENKFDIRLY